MKHNRSMFADLADRSVLITGATGSFGRHITRELVREGRVKRLTVFSRDEERQRVLEIMLDKYDTGSGKMRIDYVLGDVRDRDSVSKALIGADIVINAAALKQVPACELNSFEAVKTNVLGMQNILDAASDRGVQDVITISTDKAVKPINAMGMSKAMQERLVQSHSLRYPNPRVTVVRYGNVLGSTGSVLPVFVAQLRSSGRLRVTSPTMTRFLLTLDEALGLVSRGLFGIEETGTVYVRHASAVTVQQVAEVVLSVFGDGDTDRIDVVGPRPGDKSHEVLVSEDEMRRASLFDECFVIPPIRTDEELFPAPLTDVAGPGPSSFDVHDQPGRLERTKDLVDDVTGSSWTGANGAGEFSSEGAPRMTSEALESLVRQWRAQQIESPV